MGIFVDFIFILLKEKRGFVLSTLVQLIFFLQNKQKV